MSESQEICFDLNVAPTASGGVPAAEEGAGKGLDAVLTDANRMWANGAELTYRFISEYPGTARQQSKVHRVIKEWEDYANVSFVYEDSAAAILRIGFNPLDGSWSYVGRDIELSFLQGKATMNLGWINNTTDDITEKDRGVILHEVGHTLGLLHEHQSPVRGGTLTLKEKEILEAYGKTWTEEMIKHNILNVYNKKDVSNYSKVDLTSIMMYFMPAKMNVEGIEVKANYKLSDTDKAYITINYPRAEPVGNGWTVENALKFAGVSDADANVLLEKFKAGPDGWEDLRKGFNALTDKLTLPAKK